MTDASDLSHVVHALLHAARGNLVQAARILREIGLTEAASHYERLAEQIPECSDD